MFTIGFTGTRSGLTEDQYEILGNLIRSYADLHNNVFGVHGDCVGADASFDALCKVHKVPTAIRPCTFSSLRAYCKGEILAEPKRPMQRNREIVADADVLFGCPPNKEPIKKGSGTWATIRMAKKAGIKHYIIYPDGDLDVVEEKE